MVFTPDTLDGENEGMPETNPLGSSPFIMASIISGARVVNFKVLAT
jgi:hypothetical protein